MARPRTALCLFFASLLARGALGAEPRLPEGHVAARRPAVSLEACLERARAGYASIDEARARLVQAQAQLAEARSAPFSRVSTKAGIAVAPTLRGTGVYSPNTDVALSRNLALGWQASIDGTIPLWTFGKITNTIDAAKAGVAVKKHEAKKIENEIVLSVKRAYWGAMAARDGLVLLRDAAERIDKHLGKLEQDVEDEIADEVGLYKMKIYRAELSAHESEAQHQERVALSGLRVLIGAATDVTVVDEPLAPPGHALAPLSHYLSAARLYRPELNMARAGVDARLSQLRAQQAAYYPDIGLSFSGSWSQAPEVADQLNPFVQDSANFLRYGLALGLRWDLDFFPQAAKTRRLGAQVEEMRATERYADAGIVREVEVAHDNVRTMAARYSAYGEAVDFARRWMITVQQGLDIGAYEPEDVIAPAKEYATKRFMLLSALLDYRMAVAELALATGYDGFSDE